MFTESSTSKHCRMAEQSQSHQLDDTSEDGRGKIVADEEHHEGGVSLRTTSLRQPTTPPPQQGMSPPLVKYLTCFFWAKFGYCNKTEKQCLYSHHNTGRVAGPPVRREPGSESRQTLYNYCSANSLIEPAVAGKNLMSARPRYINWNVAHGLSTEAPPHQEPVCEPSTALFIVTDTSHALDDTLTLPSNLKLVPASLSPTGHINRRAASDPSTSKNKKNGYSISGQSSKKHAVRSLPEHGSHAEGISKTQEALERLNLSTKTFHNAFVEDLGNTQKELKIIESLMTMLRSDNADLRFTSDILGKLKGQVERRLARGFTAMQRMEDDKVSVRTTLKELGFQYPAALSSGELRGSISVDANEER